MTAPSALTIHFSTLEELRKKIQDLAVGFGAAGNQAECLIRAGEHSPLPGGAVVTDQSNAHDSAAHSTSAEEKPKRGRKPGSTKEAIAKENAALAAATPAVAAAASDDFDLNADSTAEIEASPQVTIDMCRSALNTLAADQKRGGMPAAKALLVKFGVTKVPELKEAQYAAFHAEATAGKK